MEENKTWHMISGIQYMDVKARAKVANIVMQKQ
jgi:hypothetical protein